MRRPSSVRIGMFWRFGFDDDSRPVAATSWLNEVWMRPVRGWMSAGSASAYVPFSLASWRYSRIFPGSACPSASSSSTSTSVE